MEIYNLPYELQEHIVLFSGLDVAIILNNKYIIKKILKENDLGWEELINNYSVYTIKYLININYKKDDLQYILNDTAYRNCHFFDYIIMHEENIVKGVYKLNFLNNLFKHSMITIDMVSGCHPDYMTWIQQNFPITFISHYIKK